MVRHVETFATTTADLERLSARLKSHGVTHHTGAAVRVKASYHSALFYRLRARRGAKKAIVAVAASMLTAIHVMLARGVPIAISGPITSSAPTRSAWPPA